MWRNRWRCPWRPSVSCRQRVVQELHDATGPDRSGLLRALAKRLREAVGLQPRVGSVRVRCNPGQRTEGDRLVRGARPIGPDFLDRHAASVGNDGARDRTAEAALTRSHAATYKGLDLVRPLRPQAHGAPNLTGRNLLAAADN